MLDWYENPTAKDAYVLSWVSIVFTLVAAIGGIAAFKPLDSSLLLVYGLENCVDFFSSAVVLWRFNKPSPTDSSTEESQHNTMLNNRELRAQVAISFVLVLLGFGVVVSAIEDFARGKERGHRDNLWILYYLSFLSLLIFGLMATVKFKFADKLDSPSLYKDGVCSLIGAATAAALFINSVLIITTDGGAWWLDPLVAIICGIGCFVYGLLGIYRPYVKDGLPIFSCSWWRDGQGSNTGAGVQDLEMSAVPANSQSNNAVDTGSSPVVDSTIAAIPTSTRGRNKDGDGIFGKDAVDITDVDLT